jgi:hypothetical protein
MLRHRLQRLWFFRLQRLTSRRANVTSGYANASHKRSSSSS